MSALAELRDRFKIEASIDGAEEIADQTVEQWLSDAIVEHNSAYSSEGTNLPAREVPLIFTLAKISICQHRAEKFVNQGDLSGIQGYGHDRNTPFAKNLALAKFLREEYQRKCSLMGITPNVDDPSANTIVQGKLTRIDSDIGIRTPMVHDNTPIRASVLSAESVTSTELVLNWTPSKDEAFAEYYVFTHSATIFESWNINSSTGIARVADLAIKLTALTSPEITSIKLTGLTPATVYRFLIVTKNTSSKYAYSNEVVVTTAV